MSPEQPLSRRAFVAAASGLAASAACAGPRTHAAGGPLVHVGTFTDGTASEGVYLFRMDAATGALRPLGAVAVGPNPSFLAMHPNRRALVVANEVNDWEGGATGAVSGFARDDGTGALTLRNRRASHGKGPCYVSIDHSGRFALVANYAGGSVAVLPLGADGTLGEATAAVQDAGRGPDSRQEGPHAHCIIADPTNRYVLATDLGIDRIMIHRFDDRAGTLVPGATPYIAMSPGAGPRHLAFHPNGRVLYAVNELDLTVVALRWDAPNGTLVALQTVPVIAGLKPGDHSTADVHVAPSGRFLYVSMRGDNSLAVHAIDPGTGALTPVQRIACGGDWPRNFGLDPSGRFLYAANQKSNDIVVFRIDDATGRLTPTGDRVSVPAPVCVRFGA